MHFKGGNIINDGSCRDTSSPYKDEPKAGKKPDPPPPPKVEKKGFDWGKLALAALVVVAVVASIATFGVAATLIGAAVGAVAVSAAVGAAEGAKNNIDSQLSKNGGDNSKIDKGEVLKAAFFGAVTGAKDMLLTETCTVADWCAQALLGITTLASMAAEYMPFGSVYQNTAERTTKDIQNLASYVHQFYKDAAPYKEAFEYGEIVLDAASLPALAESITNIGGKIGNVVSRAMNPGTMQLGTESGIVISAVSREAAVVSSANSSGAIVGLGGIINMAKSISGEESSGSKVNGKNSDTDLLDSNGKFKDSNLQSKYDEYCQGKSNSGKKPREPLDWKKASEKWAANRQAGRDYEIEKFAEFKNIAKEAQEQITIVTNDAEGIEIRTRVDAIGIDKETGKLRIQEYKSSETAPLTENQEKAFDILLKDKGGVVVGEGKGIFTDGYEIPRGTNVEIIRKTE